MLELLATVSLPHKGEILYQERSALSDLPLVRSQIGYVPSEIELYENMTPTKLLLYLSEMKGYSIPSGPASCSVIFDWSLIGTSRSSGCPEACKGG